LRGVARDLLVLLSAPAGEAGDAATENDLASKTEASDPLSVKSPAKGSARRWSGYAWANA
jgi:hypothetical protein